MNEMLLKLRLVKLYSSTIDLYKLSGDKATVEIIRDKSSKLGITMDKYLRNLGFKLKYKPFIVTPLCKTQINLENKINSNIEIIDIYRKEYLRYARSQYKFGMTHDFRKNQERIWSEKTKMRRELIG